MPLGIRPTNDFAFIKVFGSADDSLPLISLLNAILQLAEPITNVWLDNPINPRDKRMYDAREKAIRDQRWVQGAFFADGKIEGRIEERIEGIQRLQGMLGEPLGDADELRTHSLEELQAITDQLSERVRNRL